MTHPDVRRPEDTEGELDLPYLNHEYWFAVHAFDIGLSYGINSGHQAVALGELRDRFATAAMQAALSTDSRLPDEEFVARNAYKMADAMLCARGQQ